MRRSVKVAYPCLLGSVLVAWLAVPARGDIALESYSDQRPLDAEYVLSPLKAALERHHVVTAPALILEVDAASSLPLPGNPDRGITRTKLIDRIDRGINRAAHEAYDDAATILEAVFRDLDNNPALAAADPESRSWITKARVALAFAYFRSKRLKLANDVIVEHIRSYPELSLKGEQEEVERLYAANLAIVGTGPRGTLVFRVNLPDAAIFVNDVERGRGTIEVSLIPGDYRIVVRATGVYRRYKVTIHPDETVTRSVDWAADAAFTATSDWIGFVWRRGARRSVTTFVQQLAQRSASDAVIVIGIAQHDGHRYLTAKRYDAAPRPHRPGRAVELGQGNAASDANDGKIEALAAYITASDAELAKLPPNSLIAISSDDELAAPAAAARAAVAPARWPIFAAVGVLGTSIPFGALLLKTHNDCFADCSRVTAPAGWGLLGLGGLALGFGIVWIVRSDGAAASSPPILDVRPVPGGAVAYINGSF
jgi:hypothetical protein